MDDREAVEKTLAGEADAFEALVSRYQGKAYAAALARVYDPQDARDLVQESFLRAYTRLPMLTNRDSFGPWLFTILRRLSTDLLRGRWRAGQRGCPKDESGAFPATDPRPGIAARDSAKTLWSLICQLDANSREVLSLHYGQEMTVGEIAALTGVGESAIKMRLKKARAVLSDRAVDLQRVWSAIALPVSSLDVMAGIKAAAPITASMPVAGAFLGALLTWFGFSAAIGWSASKDAERWRDLAPARMVGGARRDTARSVLIGVVGFLLAMLFAPYLVRLGPLAVIPYFIAMAALMAWIFWREIALTSPREKVRQSINAAGVVGLFAIMFLNPIFCLFLAYVGTFLALQYFLVNRAHLVQGVVRAGFWMAPLLRRAKDCGASVPVPIEMKRVRPWITLLHELGLVAPPCKTEPDAVAVRLRVRGGLFEKMACSGRSTLRVDTHGAVTCTITPRDYVDVAQYFDDDTIPMRRELGEALSRLFTKALGVYIAGGDREAVVESLGLSACPLDPRKTWILRMNTYVIPITGILLLAASLLIYLSH